MGLLKLLPVLLVGLGLNARGGIIYSRFANGGNVPDGTSAGWSATATASGFLPSISEVSVNLSISGGFNGDLYAYLSYNEVLVVLKACAARRGCGDFFHTETERRVSEPPVQGLA